MRSRRTLAASGLILILVIVAACGAPSAHKVSVVEVRPDQTVCVYDEYFGGRRCTQQSDFDSIGGVHVGDCLVAKIMLESDRVIEASRATDCPTVPR